MKDSREAFEAWAQYQVGAPSFEGRVTPQGRWVYRYQFMEKYWQCWQRARDALTAELAEQEKKG